MYNHHKIYNAILSHFYGRHLTALVLALMLCVLSEISSAAETRCGWLENPTPANLWLTDAEGSWTLSTQGGEQLDDASMNNLPATNANEFVETNGFYGYSCVCLKVRVDKKQNRILQVYSGKALLLKKCLEDQSLPSVIR